MNRQCDKKSKLEFVATQFGVNFVVIYNLQHYVDRVCQRYLHHSIYFENFVSFKNYFMILSYFVYFQGHLIIFLIWIYDFGKPSQLGRNFAAFLLDYQIDGGRRG